MISRLISIGFLLSADPNIVDLLQREHPQILAGKGVGYGKNWLLAYKTGSISETVEDRAKVTINSLYKVVMPQK